MKTVLITGACEGIGLEIAKQLGEQGFRVWLSGRKEADGKRVVEGLAGPKLSVEFVRLDAGNFASIRQSFKIISRTTKSLDVLINNAAVHLDQSSSILEASAEMFMETLNINVMGPLFITQTYAPLLQKGSRVINVSSGAGQISKGMTAYAPAYSISKTALNAVTCQLALALKSKGVAVNAVTPGWVRTRMGGSTATRSVEQGAETPIWLATEAPIDQTGLFWRDKEVIPW